jgi:hypothetical protein
MAEIRIELPCYSTRRFGFLPVGRAVDCRDGFRWMKYPGAVES